MYAISDRLLKALSWLGGLGTRGVAAMFALGIAMPFLGPVLRPYLTLAIVAMLVVAFLRVKPEALRQLVAKPLPVLIVTGWMMIITPLLTIPIIRLVAPQDPGLVLGIALQVAAPPTMTSAAYAALLGLDAAYGLALLLASMAMTPLTAPTAASLVAGAAVPIEVLPLTLRLALIVGGAVAAALVLRRLTGQEALERHKSSLDGLTMVLLFIFAAAIMDAAFWLVWSNPLELLKLLAVVFLVALVMTWTTIPLFRFLGHDTAFTAGLCAGHRNMGVLVAAMGATALPDTTIAYFAMAQFPVYLAPALIGWVSRRTKR
jgi:predicted Na+-dependent transporter